MQSKRFASTLGALLLIGGSAAAAAAAHPQGFSITNTKSENIGKVVLAHPSTMRWIAYGGGAFKLTASKAPAAQGVVPLVLVSAHGGHGKLQLAPGTYVLKVTAVASWEIKVTP